MPTPADVPLVSAPAPPGVAAPVARAVEEDLQAIFPNAAARSNAGRPKLGFGHGERRRRAPSRTAAIGALAAAALVGVSAGAVLSRGQGREAPAQRTDDGRLKLVVAPTAEPSRTPASSAERIALISAPTASLPNPGPLAAPQFVRTVSQAPPSAERPVVKAKAVKRSLRILRESERASVEETDATPLGRCGGDCGHEDVMEADARLRRAYAAAVDAGAPRSVIAGYRKEWANLRHRAPDHPRLVVWRYSAMASDLERYAGRSQSYRRHDASDEALAGERYADDAAPSDTPRRKRPGPLKALRAELASLWP